MKNYNLIDTIEPDIKFSISEASEVDGEHVLARIKGEFFVPDGKSRNKRFYPSALWQRIIASPTIQSKLNNKLMFGTIGHDGEIGEKAMREGLISHFMTSIMIENGKGIGEALIVNTQAGRVLNTLLRAGCKLFVSSRANGTFKGEKDGMPVVDPDSYELEGWDFVIEAGFLEANPQLAESLNDLQKNKNSETLLITEKKKDLIMEGLDAKLVQHIVDENADLKNKIGKLTEEMDAVKADKDLAEKEVADLKADAEEKDKKVEKLAKYEEIGEPEELEAGMAKKEEAEKELDGYKELGDSAEEVKEALTSAKKYLSHIRENFGTVPEIKKAFDESIAFKAEVDAIGTIQMIKETLDASKKRIQEEEDSKKEADAKALADELGLSVEEVKELLLKNSPEEIKKMYAKVSEAFAKKNESNRYVKKPTETIVEGAGKGDENNTDGKFSSSSRVDRINEQFTR